MILLLSEIFPPIHGGSGRWFFELYRRLKPNSVQIVTHKHQTDAEAQSENKVDTAYNQRILRTNMSSTQWGLKSIIALKFYFSVLKQVWQLDLSTLTQIHVGRCLPEGFMGWVLSVLKRKPLTCFVHGEDIEAARTSREQSLMVKLVFKRASTIICNSSNSKNLLTEFWHVPEHKIQVLNPGVNVETFKPAAEDMAFKTQQGWQDKVVCLTVGRLQKRKGHDKFIESIPTIAADVPNFLYVIVGNGDEYPHLKQLVSDLNVQDYVQFKTDTTDAELIQCYQQCDLFALPNRTVGNDLEGFGMVLAEAQACGKPVLAGKSGGTYEALIDGKTGLLTDCTSTDAIATSISALINGLKDKTFTAESCQQFIMDKLTWDKHAVMAQQIFGLAPSDREPRS